MELLATSDTFILLVSFPFLFVGPVINGGNLFLADGLCLPTEDVQSCCHHSVLEKFVPLVVVDGVLIFYDDNFVGGHVITFEL